MEERFEDDELAVLAAQFRKLADLCAKHGYVDGASAATAQAKALQAEINERIKAR